MQPMRTQLRDGAHGHGSQLNSRFSLKVEKMEKGTNGME